MKKRVDANQKEIVDFARCMGASVFILSDVGCGFPDLIIGIGGYNFLIEIKSDDGKLSDAQLNFIREWRGQVSVVRSPDDLIEYIGGVIYD